MRQALSFEAPRVPEAGAVSFSMREPTPDERRSYFSKKSRHLSDDAYIAAPRHYDLPHLELPSGKRDPRMRHEHRGRAQVSPAGRAQHLEEIRQAFGAGNRDRFDSAALPAGEERSRVGVGPRTAVAFGVLDSRAPRFESGSQPFAPALPAKDHDRAPLQLLQLGKFGERLAVGLASRRYHRMQTSFLERNCGPVSHCGRAQALRPAPARRDHRVPPHRRRRADENRELESVQARDQTRDRRCIFRRQDLDGGKENRVRACRADPLGQRQSVLARASDHDTAARERSFAHDKDARMASAPSARSFAASISPSFSGAAIGPIDSARTTLLPSGIATRPRRRISAPLVTAYAARGSWQSPDNARLSARSASTQADVSKCPSGASRRRSSLRSSRHSITSAPCPGAGRLCSGSSIARIRAARPSRLSPAAASTTAWHSPRSSLASRVSRLPRNGCTLSAGWRSRNCASRRRLDVPTMLPGGNASRVALRFDTRQSRGSSLAVIAARQKGSGRRIGTSFAECTAISARPTSSAASSSLTKRPLPPIWASGRSTIWSPRVVIPRMLTSQFGYRRLTSPAMCSDCHIARRLLRDAMTIRSEPRFKSSSLAYERLDLRPLPAAHRQPFVDALQDHRPPDFAFGLGAALDTAYPSPRHQAIAMDPHEHAGEFLLELRKRLLDQVLAGAGPYRDVFELGSEVNHVRDADESHAPALGNAQEAPRGRIDALKHAARQPCAVCGLLQSGEEPHRANRLGQVVHGVDLERLDRVTIVRGDENHGGRPLQNLQVPCKFDAAHFRHVDVDQDDLRFRRGDDLQALHAVRRFARNGMRQLSAAVLQKLAQAVAGRFLVVDDDHSERGHTLVR